MILWKMERRSIQSMYREYQCIVFHLAIFASLTYDTNHISRAGNSNAVRGAQFVGILVGVLFEDECPQGLQHIAFGFGHKLLLDGSKKIHKRLVAVSLLRLAVGYMFLASLFLNVVQNSEVIGIFYDVLALEFVENVSFYSFQVKCTGFTRRYVLTLYNSYVFIDRLMTLHLPWQRRGFWVRSCSLQPSRDTLSRFLWAKQGNPL